MLSFSCSCRSFQVLTSTFSLGSVPLTCSTVSTTSSSLLASVSPPSPSESPNSSSSVCAGLRSCCRHLWPWLQNAEDDLAGADWISVVSEEDHPSSLWCVAVGLGNSRDGELSQGVAAGDVGVGVTGGGVDTRDSNGGDDGARMDAPCGPLDTVKLKPVSLDWFCNACRCSGCC